MWIWLFVMCINLVTARAIANDNQTIGFIKLVYGIDAKDFEIMRVAFGIDLPLLSELGEIANEESASIKSLQKDQFTNIDLKNTNITARNRLLASMVLELSAYIKNLMITGTFNKRMVTISIFNPNNIMIRQARSLLYCEGAITFNLFKFFGFLENDTARNRDSHNIHIIPMGITSFVKMSIICQNVSILVRFMGWDGFAWKYSGDRGNSKTEYFTTDSEKWYAVCSFMSGVMQALVHAGPGRVQQKYLKYVPANIFTIFVVVLPISQYLFYLVLPSLGFNSLTTVIGECYEACSDDYISKNIKAIDRKLPSITFTVLWRKK